MGAVNSCCIPRKSGIEWDKKDSKAIKKKNGHRRNLSATFNMSLLDDSNAQGNTQLNINTATEEELMTLPGINRVTAKVIIDYRKQIGGFKRVEDLALVSGVGATKLGVIRDEICVRRTNGSANSTPEGSQYDPSVSTNNGRRKEPIVSVNSSNVFQLMKVKGIGQTLAENIVSYRDKKGPFKSLDDLVKVKGIGQRTLDAIRHQLTLEDVVFDSASCSSSKKSSNLNDAIPSRNSEASLPLDPPANLGDSFSKSSLENLLDQLGPISEKPVRAKVDLPKFKCNNRNALKIASWNLEKLSVEKVNNPGVRDVVCMTILEQGFSVLAVQEVEDQEALQKICDELNTPTLPNVQRWAGHRGNWKCVVSDVAGRMYMANEYNGFLYDETQGVRLVSSCLLKTSKKPSKVFTRRPFIGTFKLKKFDCVLVSVHLKATGLNNEDLSRLQDEIDRIPTLVSDLLEQIPDEKDIIILGDFNLTPATKDFDALRKQGFHNCIADGTFTNISDANAKGSKTYDNIWIAKETREVYTGHSGVVREGLTSPWIPKGWSWGGVVSDHCPVWAQFYTGKDLDSGDLKIGPEAIKFTVGVDG